jgi:HTH-type transcriptional regulator/antitoxin HipB
MEAIAPMSGEAFSVAVLGTLTEAEREALARWLRERGVEPHRRGMAPRAWVPVDPPEPGWTLEAALAPGVRPVYLTPPSVPGSRGGRTFPITEVQAAYAARVRRERAARAARGEPERETAHDWQHRRLEEQAAADEAARSLGAALRAWREKHGLSQTEFARRLGMARPNLSRLEHGTVAPTLPVCQRVARATGGEVHLVVTPTAIAVELEAPAA